MDFDAIVVGSGMSGGWAAKELCERGLKVLVIERGKEIKHGEDYLDYLNPWELQNRGRIDQDELARDYPIQRTCYALTTANKHLFVKDSDHPYTTPDDKPFNWLRGYHLGGRSLLWARHSYRWSDLDFEANARDGHGTDWPIRYADMAPWYDHVERFAGISGERMGLPQLPDGEFLPPMELNAVEKYLRSSIETNFPGRRMMMGRIAHLTQPNEIQQSLNRGQCQYRDFCYRGCSFGAYFSSLSATLPAAQRTGNLTIVTDAIGHSILQDPATGRITGVRVIDYNTKQGREYTARIVFLNASAIGTAAILLNSANEANPNGLVNRSDQVGRNLMDHVSGIRASGKYAGFEDRYYAGRRPGGFYIPRYRNLNGGAQEADFVRGFGMQGSADRGDWNRGAGEPGVGTELKSKLHGPGGWSVRLSGFCEMLPNPENRVTLGAREDKWGIPLPHIDCAYGPNELKMAEQVKRDQVEILTRAGFTDITTGDGPVNPGYGIHEMGTARMGRDPATSVLNAWSQAHDAPNLFITDGACMASSACQNPSLTYMAMSARAANHAADLMQEGAL